MAKTKPHIITPWYDSWRSFAAYVYLLICLTDFIFMPVYYEYTNKLLDDVKIVELATRIKDPALQVEALKVLHDRRIWKPLTLSESGLLHVAFGAILGVSAWTRGKEKFGIPPLYGSDSDVEDMPEKKQKQKDEDA